MSSKMRAVHSKAGRQKLNKLPNLARFTRRIWPLKLLPNMLFIIIS